MSYTLIDDSLEPTLQAYFDLWQELEPDNELDQFEAIRQALRYCIAKDCDPVEELEAIQMAPDPHLTYVGHPITDGDQSGPSTGTQ